MVVAFEIFLSISPSSPLIYRPAGTCLASLVSAMSCESMSSMRRFTTCKASRCRGGTLDVGAEVAILYIYKNTQKKMQQSGKVVSTETILFRSFFGNIVFLSFIGGHFDSQKCGHSMP